MTAIILSEKEKIELAKKVKDLENKRKNIKCYIDLTKNQKKKFRRKLKGKKWTTIKLQKILL